MCCRRPNASEVAASQAAPGRTVCRTIAASSTTRWTLAAVALVPNVMLHMGAAAGRGCAFAVPLGMLWVDLRRHGGRLQAYSAV